MRVDYPLDTSTFVRISIEEVLKTLVEAIALVFLVMYLFLQNIRATLIPTIVVPVALLGTFAAMLAFGFSINVLTMFGMVLAIGILVDDAIVVVENVERIMAEEGLSPLEATRKAMSQITGALIGITLVLTAVFIPMAFFGGSVGTIYRQFSLSLVSSMLFSVFLAMSLTPALCATLLKPIPKGHKHEKRGFFGWFNRGFRQKHHALSIVRRPDLETSTGGHRGVSASSSCWLGLLYTEPAVVVFAGGRPGLFHHQHSIAGGRDAGTHGRGAQTGGGLFFEATGNRELHHGGRFQLQRARPKFGAFVRAA